MEPSECFAHFAQAVEAAGRAAGPGLAAASGLVLECRGLVACSGVGKSGMVARRLASSLASAGRRATWLDPGAAAHGDAGLLRRDDLLVVISRSGESDEVLALALAAPCPVLVLTARPGSRLGRAARQVLLLMGQVCLALESAHAIAAALRMAGQWRADDVVVINLSGRGDKDLEHALAAMAEQGVA